ncbi:MAG: purine-binding chemotaxis protein CheW [bacterium]|jgi:purine-binding chemotaxis protein CheW
MTEQGTTLQKYREFLSKKQYLKKKSSSQDAHHDYIDVICFSLLNETYGIEILHLREILKATDIVPVPKSPDYLCGILNLRGSIITVVDLKRRLGVASCDLHKNSRVMIVQNQNRLTGLLVDQVQEIIRIDKDSIGEPSKGFPEEKRKYIKGLGKLDNQVVILPNLEKILAKQM